MYTFYTCTHNVHIKHIQLDQDLYKAAMDLPENHPYLGGSGRSVTSSVSDCGETCPGISGGTITLYRIDWLLLFLQHVLSKAPIPSPFFLLLIRDKQQIPVSFTKFLLTLDNMQDITHLRHTEYNTYTQSLSPFTHLFIFAFLAHTTITVL